MVEMIHFTGFYCHKLDSKNRVFIPAKMRKGVVDFMLTTGLDGCLYIYPRKNWESIINKFENLSLKNKYEERAFKRAFFSNAVESEVDSQGRILVPQNLREQANIKKDMVILGVSSRLELWSKEKWNKYSLYAKTISDRLKSKLEL